MPANTQPRQNQPAAPGLQAHLDALRAAPANGRLAALAFEAAAAANDANACMDILELQAGVQNEALAWVKAGMFANQFFKLGRAVRCYENALKLQPDDKAVLLLAAKACNAISRHYRAQDFFERLLDGQPAHRLPPDVLCLYAHAVAKADRAGQTPDHVITALAPYLVNDRQALRSLVNTATQCCEHQLTHALNCQYVSRWPATDLTPYEWVAWVRALHMIGNAADCGQVADAALTALNGWMDRDSLPTPYTRPDLFMAQARILALAGRDPGEALAQCLAEPGYATGLAAIKSVSKPAEAVFHANFPAWQARFKGRDVLMLANGPSLQALVPHREALRHNCDLRFVVFNGFTGVVDKILAPIGRGVDIVSMVSNDAFEEQADAVLDILASPSRPFLVSLPLLIDGQERAQELHQFRDQFLLASSHLNLPPTPGNGLNFEFVNSLGLVIPLILTAEPRRIFLFGADGGRAQSQANVYFDGSLRPGAAGNARVEEVYCDRIQAEALLTDDSLGFQLPAAAALYGVKLPPIYNVCPTSNHQVFEKINIDTALRLLSEPGAS